MRARGIGRGAWGVAILLAALHVVMAATTSRRLGPTADEIAYLTAGYSYWTTGDYRLHPENGQLSQRLLALPLLGQDLNFPAQQGRAWNEADVWAIGRDFFFQQNNDLPRMLAASRMMIALVGGVLTLLVFGWTRPIFGTAGALAATMLAAFCPNLLAHAGLATSDTIAATAFLLATAAWWRLCLRLTPGRVVAAGLAAGLLAIAKFSAALFVPMAVGIALMGIWRIGRIGRIGLAPRIGRIVLGGAMAAAIAAVVIWAAYGFRYSATADGSTAVFNRSWSEVLIENPRAGNSIMADGKRTPGVFTLEPGIVQRFVSAARGLRLLPEAYLYGLAFTDRHARGRLAYFAGEYRETGWAAFFPVAFLLKTTLPALLLLVFSLTMAARVPRWRRALYRISPLLVVAAVYGLFSITSNLNIGHRHILLLYPIAYIAAGAFGAIALESRKARWLAPALALALAWHAVESIRIRPHYLTYFNELAGGPAGGHRFFVDSSLDWGQGLPDLKAWLDRNAGDKKVFLSYFGSDDPKRLGISAVRLGDIYFDHSIRPLIPELGGGTYCISATMLHRVYTGVRGGWTASYEAAYRRLNDWLAKANARPAGTEPVDENGRTLSQTEFSDRLSDLEQLRFGRLCRFLELRQPDDLVANSIFIYRLSDSEVDAALSAAVPVADR